MIIKCSLVNGRPLFSSYPFTRVYHARDCARSRHVPSHKLTAQLRNVSFSTGHNGTRGEANRARERRIRVCTYPTLTIRPRTHPAHPSNSLRTRDTGVCHACCTVACNLPRVLPPPLPPRIFLRREANGSAFVHTSWTCTCRPDVYTTRLPFPSSFVNI